MAMGPAPAAHKPAASTIHAVKPRPQLAPLAPAKTPSLGGGHPLAPHIKEAIQNSLLVDLSAVRLHASTAAARQAQSLSARAFTFGNEIFLGHGEHPTDLTLITHETAHVIQQQAGAHVQAWSSDRGDRYEREADRAAAAVARGETFSVRERVDSPRVQRLGIGDALSFFAGAANNIPGYRMFTMVLGVNPIDMTPVERNPANVLRAIVEFIPGGGLITQALDKYGILDKVGDWVQQQLASLAIVGSSIKKALMDFLDSLSWSDIFHLDNVWDRAKHIFTDPIDRIKNFVKGFAEGIWKFLRDAILKPIAQLASQTAGWDLLIAVMGRNPITGEPVPRTPDTLIGGFMKLIHEEEIWNNLKKANAVSRAWAWFQSALSGLLGFVNQIPELFKTALKSLEWSDVINLPSGFMKLAGVFGKFLVSFASWAGDKVWDLLQIIFEVVAPAVMPYLKKVGAAFKSILKNPMAFVRNLVAGARLGFVNFGAHFLAHLKAGLIDWLTGSLPGVYIPKAFSLVEFGKFALSVLGISWGQIRAKLVKALGPNGETIMKGLETGFDIVVALVKGGPAAAWDLIKEKLTNLKDMVIDGITSFVVDTIVQKAIPKLIAMFIPGAGFISAIVSIYDTIKVFIEKLAKIAAAVKAFVDSIVAIANGQIEGAAAKVESTLSGLLSLAISFLAGFLGLGNIASKVLGVIEKVRASVDKALDTAIEWIVTKAKGLFGAAKKAVGGIIGWWKQRQSIPTDDGEKHSMYFSGDGGNAKLIVASDPMTLEEFLASKKKEAANDPGMKKALAEIEPHLKKIKSLSLLPSEKQEAHDQEFRDAFNAIGTSLVVLLGGGNWGTQSNPLPLNYTKRPAASYPVLFFGPKSEKRIPQSLLENGDIEKIQKILSSKERAAWGPSKPILRYAPTAPAPLPDGEGPIGISPTYQIAVGKIVPYKPGNTEGGGLINRTLRPYGYRAGKEDNDGDHVVEMQIGGPNILENLWPLEKGENRSSGAKLAATKVKPGTKEMTLEEASKKKGSQLWLMIVKTL